MKGNTQKNPHIFADCRLPRYARGVEQRLEQKDKNTYFATIVRAPGKQKETNRQKRTKKKTKQRKKQKSETEDTNRNTKRAHVKEGKICQGQCLEISSSNSIWFTRYEFMIDCPPHGWPSSYVHSVSSTYASAVSRLQFLCTLRIVCTRTYVRINAYIRTLISHFFFGVYDMLQLLWCALCCFFMVTGVMLQYR